MGFGFVLIFEVVFLVCRFAAFGCVFDFALLFLFGLFIRLLCVFVDLIVMISFW